jgi:hypothetical protein
LRAGQNVCVGGAFGIRLECRRFDPPPARDLPLHPCLPPLIRTKLARLARRIRAGIVLERLGAGVLAGGGAFVALFLLDRAVQLPWVAFQIALALFLAMAALLFVTLGRAVARRTDPAALAALVEQRHPELDERLLSAVELSQTADAHGGAPFRERLLDAAGRDVAPIDARAVHSLRRPCALALAAAVLVLVLVGVGLASDGFARFARRVFGAFGEPDVGYALRVDPGDTWVALGRPATVTAAIASDDPDRTPPRECFLTFARDGDAPRQVRMDAGGDGTFLYTWPEVAGDIDYQITAGERTSARHRLSAIAPILATGPVSVTVHSPPYLRQPATTYRGTAFSALQYSRLQFAVPLDRRPVRAMLHLREAEAERPVSLTYDATTGTAVGELLAVVPGSFAGELVLEAEHAIRTTVPLAGFRVVADAPPQFVAPLAVRGARQPAGEIVLNPDEPLHVRFRVEDAEGLGPVVVAYQVNDHPIRVEPLLDGGGRKELHVDQPLTGLAGWKDGDRLRLRVRAEDTRRLTAGQLARSGGAIVPEADVAPQVTYSPTDVGAGGWLVLKARRAAESLAEAELAAQHADLAKRLAAIRETLRTEHAQLGKVRTGLHEKMAMTAEQGRAAADARRLNDKAAASLDETANILDADDEMAPLADHLRAIAAGEVADAGQALDRVADRQRPADARANDVRAAEAGVLQAIKKLDGVAALGDRLAQDRRDRLELDRLAHRQRALARKVEELLARTDAADPAVQKQLAELRAEQDRLAERLQAMRQRSAAFREALAANPEAARQRLARDVERLAAMQQQRMQELDKRLHGELGKELADLAGKQADLAGRIHDEAKAGFGAARRAAELLRDGALAPAVADQRKTEAELGAWADALRSSSPGSAKELAARQKEIKEALEGLAAEFARLKESEVRDRYRALVQKQIQLHQAVRKLAAAKGPAAELGAQSERETGSAAETLARHDAIAAAEHMENARTALEQLARATPPAAVTADADAKAKQRVARVEAFAREQKQLRDETTRALAKLMQGGDPEQEKTMRADAARLTRQMRELADRTTDPKAKALADEAARAMQLAQQALDKKPNDAGKSGPAATGMDAAKAMRTAKERLDAMPAAKPPMKDDALALDRKQTAENLEESATLVQKARDELGRRPKGAPQAMRRAADALAQTARQLGRQTGRGVRLAGQDSNPANRPFGAAAPFTGKLADDLRPFAGKRWGDLPGELKTRLVQDLRARYGDDYAPIIRRYFERIADVAPNPRRPGGETP